MDQTRSSSPDVPLDSKVFGYGPMLPFVLGAIGTWFSPPWRMVAIGLTIIWGSLIITFVGGVRRGFGFGDPAASKAVEIATMMVYFTIGGLALVLAAIGLFVPALVLLTIGYLVVPVADTRAARHGDAPRHFAALRPQQMAIAAASLLAILAWIERR